MKTLNLHTEPFSALKIAINYPNASKLKSPKRSTPDRRKGYLRWKATVQSVHQHIFYLPTVAKSWIGNSFNYGVADRLITRDKTCRNYDLQFLANFHKEIRRFLEQKKSFLRRTSPSAVTGHWKDSWKWSKLGPFGIRFYQCWKKEILLLNLLICVKSPDYRIVTPSDKSRLLTVYSDYTRTIRKVANVNIPPLRYTSQRFNISISN